MPAAHIGQGSMVYHISRPDVVGMVHALARSHAMIEFQGMAGMQTFPVSELALAQTSLPCPAPLNMNMNMNMKDEQMDMQDDMFATFDDHRIPVLPDTDTDLCLNVDFPSPMPMDDAIELSGDYAREQPYFRGGLVRCLMNV